MTTKSDADRIKELEDALLLQTQINGGELPPSGAYLVMATDAFALHLRTSADEERRRVLDILDYHSDPYTTGSESVGYANSVLKKVVADVNSGQWPVRYSSPPRKPEDWE